MEHEPLEGLEGPGQLLGARWHTGCPVPRQPCHVLGSSAREEGKRRHRQHRCPWCWGCPWVSKIRWWQWGLKEEARGRTQREPEPCTCWELASCFVFPDSCGFLQWLFGWKAPSGSVFPEQPFSFVPTTSGLLWSQ